MHRIDTPTAQKDKFGQGKNGFTRGNPQTGTPATQLDYLYCDSIQEEIANAIESAGFVLDKTKHDQLATAIKEFVSKGSVKLNSSTNSESETEAATPLAVKKANDNAAKANTNANNAHNRIGDISDKFELCSNESRVHSHDKRFYLFVRDDGVVAMYNRVSNRAAWGFNSEGSLCEGYVPAERVTNLDLFVRDKMLPAGIPQPWPSDHIPNGWFLCNGAQFDVNQFPKLAGVYPRGTLPDLRGVFIRGKDNGRGLDPNRNILSFQNDAIRNIWGDVGPISETFGQNGGTGTGAFRAYSRHASGTPTKVDVGDAGGINFDASRVVPVSHDNHPSNVAFNYIVRAE
ncbi:phage tail protein [Gilliamella sp. ESL0443]|uniref:phage tail protein n=1 Tax=Gilliamella sp. ESL0443 TaxID=2704655 RepID=UPI001C69AF78|nr:phage tail protein [Gilliamella sp. ESL0443]